MLTSSTDMNIPVTRTSSETIHGVDLPRERAGEPDGDGGGVGGAGACAGAVLTSCSAGSVWVVPGAVGVVVTTGL
jgi:hypothetical protein